MTYNDWADFIQTDDIEFREELKQKIDLHAHTKEFAQQLAAYLKYKRFANIDTAIDMNVELKTVGAINSALQEIEQLLEE